MTNWNGEQIITLYNTDLNPKPVEQTFILIQTPPFELTFSADKYVDGHVTLPG
jgi:hypothetical protein